MSKEVVRWVISHTGKKGGPWEAEDGAYGDPTLSKAVWATWSYDSHGHATATLTAVREVWPNAKVLPVVRRTKRPFLTEEQDLVDVVMAWYKAEFTPWSGTAKSIPWRLQEACAKLRAKRKALKEALKVPVVIREPTTSAETEKVFGISKRRSEQIAERVRKVPKPKTKKEKSR